MLSYSLFTSLASSSAGLQLPILGLALPRVFLQGYNGERGYIRASDYWYEPVSASSQSGERIEERKRKMAIMV